MGALGSLPDDSFKSLASPDQDVDMFIGFVEGDKRGVVRATTTVHATPEECAGFNMHKMTRDSTIWAPAMEKNLIELGDHSFIFQLLVDHGIPGFVPREYLWRAMWKWSSDEVLLVAYEPHASEQFPVRPEFVRGTGTVLLSLQKLPALHGFPRTRLSYIQRTDAGGNIPASLLNRFASTQLQPAVEIKDRFDKTKEIDDAAWAAKPKDDVLDGAERDARAREMEYVAHATRFTPFGDTNPPLPPPPPVRVQDRDAGLLRRREPAGRRRRGPVRRRARPSLEGAEAR
jgi:hypothetical protein